MAHLRQAEIGARKSCVAAIAAIDDGIAAAVAAADARVTG